MRLSYETEGNNTKQVTYMDLVLSIQRCVTKKKKKKKRQILPRNQLTKDRLTTVKNKIILLNYYFIEHHSSKSRGKMWVGINEEIGINNGNYYIQNT